MSFSALVVGCDEDSQRTLDAAFREYAVQVESCAAAESALAALKDRHFGAVFVDCEQLDGTARSVLSAAKESSLQSILFALVAENSPANSGFDVGANLVLQKPVSEELAKRSLLAVQGFRIREERRWSRHPISMLVELKPKSANPTNCHARNISEGGICVQTALPLAPRDAVSINFELPRVRARWHAKGEVRWTDANGHAGIRFVAVTGRGRLGDWIPQACEQSRPELFLAHR